MVNKKWWIVLVLSILIIPVVSAQYYPWSGSCGYGYGGGDLFYLYEDYYQLIDFLVFFAIFLAVTKSVFEKENNFKSQGNLLSVALSLFLAFTLIRWEVENGYSLGGVAGYLGLIILVVFTLLFLWNLYKKFSSIGGGH